MWLSKSKHEIAYHPQGTYASTNRCYVDDTHWKCSVDDDEMRCSLDGTSAAAGATTDGAQPLPTALVSKERGTLLTGSSKDASGQVLDAYENTQMFSPASVDPQRLERMHMTIARHEQGGGVSTNDAGAVVPTDPASAGQRSAALGYVYG